MYKNFCLVLSWWTQAKTSKYMSHVNDQPLKNEVNTWWPLGIMRLFLNERSDHSFVPCYANPFHNQQSRVQLYLMIDSQSRRVQVSILQYEYVQNVWESFYTSGWISVVDLYLLLYIKWISAQQTSIQRLSTYIRPLVKFYFIAKNCTCIIQTNCLWWMPFCPWCQFVKLEGTLLSCDCH